MSDTDLLTVRLEDGEIDESNESSVLPEHLTEKGIVKDLRVIVKNFIKAGGIKNCDQPTSAIFDGDRNIEQNRRKSSEVYNSEKVYLNDQEIVYIDEDEMLCVRGASPVPFVVERLSYSRKSPLQDCDNISFDTTPPKRRRTSGKRDRKRSSSRKKAKDTNLSSDEQTEQRKSSSRETSQSPQETQDKLPQLCKFYLKDSCVKRYRCEYMHSEFPCKLYYMGLKCEDETSETGCKLSHGGPLSAEMRTILARHINTAPIDVLGEEFVNMRSNMQTSEINQMLSETEDNLKQSKNVSQKISSPKNNSFNFFDTLREKLFFLNEAQLNGLQKLEIAKVDDLLNLTLGQLNAIGIHATQIEAIQMSFVAGQDTDMRNILPTQIEEPVKEKIPNFEIVCYQGENVCGANWFEEEERPLVIDETNDLDDDRNEDKSPEEDDIIIDVVGDSSNDSYSCIIEEEIEGVDQGAVLVSAASSSTDQSQHFVIEENQEGIQILSKSAVPDVKYPLADCSTTFNDINKNELEILEKSKELTEEIQENLKNQDDAQSNESTHKLICEEIQDEIQDSSKNQDKDQFDENINELELLQTSEKLQDETQCSQNQDQTQIDDNSKNETENYTVAKDLIDEQIEMETVKEIEEQSIILSPRKETEQPVITHEDEKQISPIPLISQKEDKSTPPHFSIKSPKENICMSSPNSENVVAEIDLTNITPPRRSTELSLPVRYKVESKREYINPFQRKCVSPGNETKQRYSPIKAPMKEQEQTKQRYSPIKKQKPKYLSQPNFKKDHQMQGDNSSEDWDADERSDIQSPPKEIASPDQSEDESTPFVADGTCPELPRRTKNLDNYQPAFEINAHLTYPPMEYKLYEIYMPQYEVNKPTLMEKLIRSNSTDPRLKKFIEKEKNHGVFPQAEYSFFPPNISQCDPRLRPGGGTNCQDQYYNASRILYSYLQRSQWYQELKSNLKIQINHSVSDLVRALNFFHKDPSPQKIFDLFQIECAGVLLEVMRNVGIFIDVNGNITEEANYKQLCAPPMQHQQPPQPFPSACLGPNSKPGLLGFAPPGVPHPHQNNSPMSSENNFARQAFGHDCICTNNNNDFQPIGPFYVGSRYGMNRNQEPGFDSGFEPPPAPPYQRQNQKRNFKRR